MSSGKIQLGQIWKKVDSEETFLVTRLYSEALTSYAVLRPAGNEKATLLRVKIERAGDSQTLPGFVMAHASENF
jgi:hypothetical protein